VSFRARHLESLPQVFFEGLEDHVGQPPLETAQCFQRLLALGALAVVIVLPGAGVPDLNNRRDVQGVVETSVPATVEAVPVLVAAAHVERRGAGLAGEVMLGPEPADVPDVG
jgi:hypothetical protein